MELYYAELATAFVRGCLGDGRATIEDGLRAGLRLHKFKADARLPRVQRVIGILRGMAPSNLLDLGSGRGTFLWPLMDAFPGLPVTAVDADPRRISDIGAVRQGGVSRLTPVRMDIQRLAFAPRSFDVVTMLEVMEHLPSPAAALACALAAARRFVVVSVPSTPDDNPEHLHLFTPEQLRQLASGAGAGRIAIEHVLNHRIAVLRTAS